MLKSLVAVMFLIGSDADAGIPAGRSGSEELWKWPPHSTDRPIPPVVKPEPESALALSAKAPAGAVVLFAGADLSAWKPTGWEIHDGCLHIRPGSGRLTSREGFGSCKLHLEWRTGAISTHPSAQMRCNSGVFFMSRYEVQILAPGTLATYADGLAGAVYGQYPPKVLPLRPACEWQHYDIEFHRPIFSGEKVVKPARITARFNGVPIHDNVELCGPTDWKVRPDYAVHADKLPLMLQDHGSPVSFRNIWVLPLVD